MTNPQDAQEVRLPERPDGNPHYWQDKRGYAQRNSSCYSCSEANAYFDHLERQLAAVTEERDKAVEVLGMIYDKWENGDGCYEDPDECAGYLGAAVRLSEEEDNSILMVFERAGIKTALGMTARAESFLAEQSGPEAERTKGEQGL